MSELSQSVQCWIRRVSFLKEALSCQFGGPGSDSRESVGCGDLVRTHVRTILLETVLTASGQLKRRTHAVSKASTVVFHAGHDQRAILVCSVLQQKITDPSTRPLGCQTTAPRRGLPSYVLHNHSCGLGCPKARGAVLTCCLLHQYWSCAHLLQAASANGCHCLATP